MGVTMLISLYTSRVVLETLGVEDFGIYNVVGGVVAMFSMLSGSLSAAISRFMTFELGKGDGEKLHRVFCSSVNIQLILSAIILVLSETVGLWFLNTQMNIPEPRMSAANWVFQCSILTFILGLISSPYNASVISHERMSFFAVVSISEAVVKLIIVVSLQFAPADKLVTYAVALTFLALAVRILYGAYCSRHFDECHYSATIDKPLVKQMFTFAGWNFFGSGSWLLMNQGVNILINIFFGVVFNAARGIATQVETAVNSFVASFTTALNPQITKDYARGELDQMLKLIYAGSKYSFFLMLFVALPILLETETILDIWLKNTPEYAVLFVRLTIMISLLAIVSNTMIIAMLATGNIRNYQLAVGGLGMLIFPIVWMLYKFGMPVWVSYVVHFLIFVLQLTVRLFMLRRMVGLNITHFLRYVIQRDISVFLLSSLLPIVIIIFIDASVLRMLLTLSVSIISVAGAVYFVGLTKDERGIVIRAKAKLVSKFTKHS